VILYPEPIWTTSQPAYEPCSALAATGTTPFILTGILIRLLQYHFSDPANIINPSLRIYRWKENCNEAIVGPDNVPLVGIHVGVSYEFNPAGVQQRPAVYVKREPITVQRVAVFKGDRSVPAVSEVSGVYQGARYQKTIDGRFSLIVIATSGTEADLLGEEVFYRMLYFAPIIMDDIRIGQFTVEGMSEVKDLDGQDGTKSYYVVVSIYWAQIVRWAAIAETPILKRLRLVQQNFSS